MTPTPITYTPDVVNALIAALADMVDMWERHIDGRPGPDDAAARWDQARQALAEATGWDYTIDDRDKTESLPTKPGSQDDPILANTPTYATLAAACSAAKALERRGETIGAGEYGSRVFVVHPVGGGWWLTGRMPFLGEWYDSDGIRHG